MHAARCPAHRPKYMCTVNTYNAYAVGAFKVACSWGQPVLEDFPRDHLRDIMGSFTQCSDNEPVTEVSCTVLAEYATICRCVLKSLGASTITVCTSRHDNVNN